MQVADSNKRLVIHNNFDGPTPNRQISPLASQYSPRFPAHKHQMGLGLATTLTLTHLGHRRGRSATLVATLRTNTLPYLGTATSSDLTLL